MYKLVLFFHNDISIIFNNSFLDYKLLKIIKLYIFF